MPQDPKKPGQEISITIGGDDDVEAALKKLRAETPPAMPLKFNRRPAQPPLTMPAVDKNGTPVVLKFASDSTTEDILRGVESAKYSTKEEIEQGQAKAPNPIGRAIGAWWEATNPYNFAKALMDDPLGTVKGIVTAPGRQWQKAGDLFSQGRYSEAAGHGIAGALPFIGPPLADATEKAAAGDPAGYGEMVAALQPIPLGKYAPEIKSGIQNTAARIHRSAAGAGTIEDSLLNLKRGEGELTNPNRDAAKAQAAPTPPAKVPAVPLPPERPYTPPGPTPPPTVTLNMPGGRRTFESAESVADVQARGARGQAVNTIGRAIAEANVMREPPAAWMDAEDAARASAAEQMRRGAYRQYEAVTAKPTNAFSGFAKWMEGPIRPYARSAVAQKLYNLGNTVEGMTSPAIKVDPNKVPPDLLRFYLMKMLAGQQGR